MLSAKTFWSSFLGQEPNKDRNDWLEYQLDNIRLGFLPKEPHDTFQGCNTVMMFEYDENEMDNILHNEKSLGAKVVLDSLNDVKLRSMILADPNGHEFEIGIKGTHH